MAGIGEGVLAVVGVQDQEWLELRLRWQQGGELPSWGSGIFASRLVCSWGPFQVLRG